MDDEHAVRRIKRPGSRVWPHGGLILALRVFVIQPELPNWKGCEVVGAEFVNLLSDVHAVPAAESKKWFQ